MSPLPLSILAPELVSHDISNFEFTGVTCDSRQISSGTIFVCIPGTKSNGHDFIDQALTSGAAAIVVSDKSKFPQKGILVKDCRKALSALAAHFAEYPASSMQVVAVTGTNGKTTTNWIVHQALNKLGRKSIRFGTIGVCCEGIVDLPGMLTTPDPISLHQTLQQVKMHGANACVIEASSHALDQCRIDDLSVDVAVFTNLTRDHLDYHHTMEDYFLAKRKLFDLAAHNSKQTKAAVVCLDNEYGEAIHQYALKLNLQDFSFGRNKLATIKIINFTEQVGQSVLELAVKNKTIKIKTPLIGAHNAENLTAAFGSLVALGFEENLAADALCGIGAAPGRLEYIEGKEFGIYVDYAHTPDALERVIVALRPITRNKLWVVFGCGGDRDKGKRPQMGRIAADLADNVVITSDNPRTEDPLAIIRDIEECGKKFKLIEPDRKLAIHWTIKNAQPGDSILIAGKGHEDYQIIGSTKYHLSDQEEARRALANFNSSTPKR